MENKVKAEKINIEKSAAGYAKSNTENVKVKFVSKEDEKRMLHDISRITLSAISNVDITREYVENMDLKNYLDSLNRQFANINERFSKYMSDHGVASDFFGSVRQNIQKNALKISMFTTSSDRKISEIMIKTINSGLDILAKNINYSSATLSPELLALSRDFSQILENSLSDLRKYL